jgi:hypothetical protein
LLIFAQAESLQRFTRSWWSSAAADRIRRSLVRVSIALVLAVTLAVHPVLAHYASSQRAVVDALYANTTEGGLLVCNAFSTKKYLSAVYGKRTYRNRGPFRGPDEALGPGDISVAGVVDARTAGRVVQLALLDREDSGLRQLDAEWNTLFLAELASRCDLALRFDRSLGEAGRLRIWDVMACHAAPL